MKWMEQQKANQKGIDGSYVQEMDITWLRNSFLNIYCEG